MVPVEDRISIVQMYKKNMSKDPKIKANDLELKISKCTGVSKSTIKKIIKCYNETNSVVLPKQKRAARETFRDSFDELSRNAIRRHVHAIWLRHEIPTLQKIHETISGDESLPPITDKNLYRLLKDLGFRYFKPSRSRALTEKGKIVLCRRRYLEKIMEYRKDGRHIYYLDETLVDAGVCCVALHIGSADGLVPGGLLCDESTKNNPRDCRSEISAQRFCEWIENILPLLQDNSVIVMDNAPYHTIKIDKAPTWESKKADVIKWLEDKGEIFERDYIFVELMSIVKRIEPLHKKCTIEELVKASQKTILRLPRNHHELNPMVLAWESVKRHVSMNISSNKLSDAKKLIMESVDHVNTEMWKDFISRTIEEEKKCWDVDFIVDDLLEEDMDDTIIITGDTPPSSDYESDSC